MPGEKGMDDRTSNGGPDKRVPPNVDVTRMSFWEKLTGANASLRGRPTKMAGATGWSPPTCATLLQVKHEVKIPGCSFVLGEKLLEFLFREKTRYAFHGLPILKQDQRGDC